MSKKIFRTVIPIVLALSILLTTCLLFVGCEKAPAKADLPLLPENILDDNYGNFYEIFVYSFNDTDGDGYGDLKGVTEKLDYIRDLGYTGIWLMPISPSPSYHKYDVTDYYAIDSLYGTMEDFEELISTAHSKGIKIITDLVVNHSSNSHPWFQEAAMAFMNGNTSSKYFDYYNFSRSAQYGYHRYETGLGPIYYEGQFVSTMPDLNLDSVNVRAELSNIIKFWCDKGVDGFRLDACTSYYTGNHTKSAEFVKWVTDETKKNNDDAFIVAEVWEGSGIISTYYQASPETSFFCFPASTSNSSSCYSYAIIGGGTADRLYSSMKNVYNMAGGGVPAPFLGNHDMNRVCGLMLRDPAKVKFAYGLLSLFNGTTFTYYGDEIGMVGSGNDPNRRIGMLWETEGTVTNAPPDSTSTAYQFDGVKEQLLDPDSILSYYKLANNIRNAFPEIARGSIETANSGNPAVGIVKKTYGGKTITIIVNCDNEEQKISGSYGEIKAQLSATGGSVTLSGEEYTLPAFSYAIVG